AVLSPVNSLCSPCSPWFIVSELSSRIQGTHMAAITAQLVNELRQRTGLGMNECKQVLVENNGDINAALDALRKKGVKSSIAARAATEGRLYIAKSADGKSAAIVEV